MQRAKLPTLLRYVNVREYFRLSHSDKCQEPKSDLDECCPIIIDIFKEHSSELYGLMKA